MAAGTAGTAGTAAATAPAASGATVSIRLDGRPHGVPAGSSLADLLAALGQLPDAVATAVNGDFVPRGQRAAWPLQAGDAVLLFKPITGG